MIPFNPQGLTVTFTAAATAPTAVQCSAQNDSSTQYLITNTGAATVFLGVGVNATVAGANATIPTGTPTLAIPILAGSAQTLTLQANAYFTGIAASSTCLVYVTPGYGE